MDPTQPQIAAIILAAGMSSRMGRSKALLPFGGKPLLACVIQTFAAAGDIAPIVVVTGHEADAILKILQPLPVHPLHNPAYASGGMVSSIQTGVAAVADEVDAFFIAPGDQPM